MSVIGQSRRLTVVGSVVAVAAAAMVGWFGAAPTGAVTAPTLMVSTTGNDSGTCQKAACATLGYALSQAAPGDTIVVESGTYKE